MEECDNGLAKQLMLNFMKKHMGKKKTEEERVASASRSATMDFDLSVRAANVTTRDIRELSRWVLEDLLACDEGKRFVVCTLKNLGDDTENPRAPSCFTNDCGDKNAKMVEVVLLCMFSHVYRKSLHLVKSFSLNS